MAEVEVTINGEGTFEGLIADAQNLCSGISEYHVHWSAGNTWGVWVSCPHGKTTGAGLTPSEAMRVVFLHLVGSHGGS